MRLRLLELRLAAGLSQTDLGEAIGSTRQRVANLERGATTFIELDTIAKLSAIFGVSVGDLFEVVPADGTKRTTRRLTTR